MALPLKYNVRNVFVRWRATIATILGVALVVAVYILVQSLAVGLEKTNASTGDPRNVMIVRKGATAESSSLVTREQYRLIKYLPQVARDARGQPLVSADLVIIINLIRREGNGEANVLLRGVSPRGMDLRPQVALAGGRWFVPGKREVVVSRRLSKRFANFEIGNRFKSGGKELAVVGWMDGGQTAFDSEVWMDADEARTLFTRENYSSVLARTVDSTATQSLMTRIESDKQLPLRADLETDYYASQTRGGMLFKILGNLLATMMSIGAVFAAMNTMYASVGARTREIGTLRVLGYRRRAILASFIIEGAFLAALGGLLGCGAALLLQAVSRLLGWQFGTMGFETFAETLFNFRITPALAVQGFIFSVIVGVVGSLLPAVRAARLPMIAALKAV